MLVGCLKLGRRLKTKPNAGIRISSSIVNPQLSNLCWYENMSLDSYVFIMRIYVYVCMYVSMCLLSYGYSRSTAGSDDVSGSSRSQLGGSYVCRTSSNAVDLAISMK